MKTSLQIFKNKHHGKRIWVCGTGGSLLDVNPKLIPDDDIIICCNSSTQHFKGSRIDYACYTDGCNSFDKNYLECKAGSFILFNEEVQEIHPNTFRVEKKEDNFKFLPDDTKVIFGYDVVHCAVHLAWIMGASKIILAGVDLKHSNGKKYSYEHRIVDEAPQGIHDILKETGKFNNYRFDGWLGASLGGWELINSLNSNLPIVTISQDTNLKLYPSVPFKDLV